MSETNKEIFVIIKTAMVGYFQSSDLTQKRRGLKEK